MKIDPHRQRQRCNILNVLFSIMFLALICRRFLSLGPSHTRRCRALTLALVRLSCCHQYQRCVCVCVSVCLSRLSSDHVSRGRGGSRREKRVFTLWRQSEAGGDDDLLDCRWQWVVSVGRTGHRRLLGRHQGIHHLNSWQQSSSSLSSLVTCLAAV